MKILIEGWRFLPHSYAIANHFLSLQMLEHPSLEIFSRPISNPWPTFTNLFNSNQDARFNAIPSLPPHAIADVTLRLYEPFNLLPSPSQQTVILATAPWGVVLHPQVPKKDVSNLQKLTLDSRIKIITPSRWSREGLIRSGCDPKQIFVVPFGIDPNLHHPLPLNERTALRQKLGWDDCFVFLNISSQQSCDGIRPLLKAFAQIVEQYPQARLVLKGSEVLYASTQSLLDASHAVLTASEAERIKPKLAYLGEAFSSQEIAQLYQAADAYVSPYIAVAFNLSVLEAAACGLPIICSQGGATDDFTHPDFTLQIESPVKGRLFKDEYRFFLHPNADHLADLMKQVIEQPNFCKKARESGPKLIHKRFSWEQVTHQFIDVFASPIDIKNSTLLIPGVMPSKRRIRVEGWRSIPHSYALINSYQLVEFMKRSDVEVFHQDMPYVTEDWKATKGLLKAEAEAILDQVPVADEHIEADITLRMYCPFNLANSKSPKTAIFGCTEWGIVPPSILRGMGISSFREEHFNSDTLIITSSQWSRDGFLRSGADPERVFVVPLGIDPTIYKPLPEPQRTQLRKSLGWHPDFIFLNIGVMWNERQGVEKLLKAFATVTEKYPETKLILKGRDAIFPSKNSIKQASKNALNDRELELIKPRLKYIGNNLSALEIAQFYQAADFYVSPYLAEGFNLPVLEAIACGLPVICTDGGPTDDFTQPEFAWRIQSQFAVMDYGYKDIRFCLEPNLDHLIHLMETAIEKASFQTQVQQAGAKMVAEKYSWEKVVDQLLTLL